MNPDHTRPRTTNGTTVAPNKPEGDNLATS